MSGFRVPGPVCSTRQPWSFDDGTLQLISTHSPGPVCAASPLYPTTALQCSLRKMPEPDLDLSFLFRQCSNPVVGLTDTDYGEAAKSLGVEIAAIKAVAEVETAGNAFDESGRPTILFERHYFHDLTGGKYDAKHSDISNRIRGGYGKYSAQYEKIERAYQLDIDSALQSASWGRFQIMGKNYRAAGFDSVREFVLAMTRSESEHLKAFVAFVGSDKSILAALRKKEWAIFAAIYNGPKYKKKNYDTKLKAAYDRFSQATKQYHETN